MVRILFLMLAFCFSGVYADYVQVSSTIESDTAYENYPLTGTISITHNPKDIVDPSGFLLDGKPLQTVLYKTVDLSANMQIDFYRFSQPGQSKGVYLLGPVSVKVGNTVYQSMATSYEVTGAAKIAPADLGPQTPATLELKASVEVPKPFFPGQEGQFIYRYYFSGNIELSEEKLPLLDATGFIKVGDKVINSTQQNDLDVQEISQKVKAQSPGEYKFPASSAAGFSYVADPILKTRTYIQPKLQTEVPPITVTVSPFPDAGRPATFTGAVGQYTFNVTLVSPPTVTVGDKMRIAIEISSPTSQLNTVNLPDLNQAGIKGLFRLSDLPPVGQVQDHTMRFVEDLYPLLTGIKEIPSLAFSYFDPNTAQYVTLKSNPIPISVQARQGPTPPSVAPLPALVAPSPRNEPPPVEKAPQIPDNLQTPIPKIQPQTPAPIEISDNYVLSESDLHNLQFGSWYSLLLIPLGIGLLLLQIVLRKWLINKRNRPHVELSSDFWHKALKEPEESPQFYAYLNKALLLHLVETNQIEDADMVPEKLPTEGNAGAIREFLMHIEEQRFAKKSMDSRKQLIAEAKKLLR